MIAEVVFDLPLRRTFDYRLGDAEAARIVPGCRVVVPFGHRVRSGVVVGLKASSELPSGRLKTVQQIADAVPVFSPEMLEFTRWVADYYFCGWGEVLEASLPSGLGLRFRSTFCWREWPPSDKALGGLSDQARAFAGKNRQWDEGQWARTRPTRTDKDWLLNQVRAGGALEVEHHFAGTRGRVPTERWIEKGELPPTPPPQRRSGRDTLKTQLLRLVHEEGEVPFARLKALFKDPGRVVRPLAEEGLVRIVERPVSDGAEAGLPKSGGSALPVEPFLTLNTDQAAAFAALQGALREQSYRGFLLEGVTGSGKTEVYLHAVREALAQGRSCLLLVPEIALTAAMVDRFRARFPKRLAVLHSGMSEGDRFAAWNRVRQGEASIVIGARSALFAPMENLGLVIVDEEHDTSYKQDEAPRYNGRDAALMRASRNGAVAVLGSATPSIETVRNVALGKLEQLHLPHRVEKRPLPPVRLLNLKTTPRQKGSALFTLPLVEALRETLLREEQAILFLNRRGFGTLVRCSACDEPVLCANCSISLTFHRNDGRLHCHRCDYTRTQPERCPACEADAMEVLGIGTERIEQEIGALFPKARILRMDSDTLRRRGELERMMAAIRERRYDIVIGTQVLSKGHDFPFITLVGAILADVSLNLPDFRAPERTFQVLTQMAGRAGRGERPGRALVQTYNPDHYSLRHVRTHDVRAFAEEETAIRKAAGGPPFSSHTLLWASAPRPEKAEGLAVDLARALKSHAGKGVHVLGPAEAPIRKLHNRYRWMVLLKAPAPGAIQNTLRRTFAGEGVRLGPRERIAVDVDPYNLL